MKENPFVAMMMEKLRPEIEAQIKEAAKIARERILADLAKSSGLPTGLIQAPALTPSPFRSKAPYRTAKVRASEPPIDWKKEKRLCKRCGDTKFVDPDFGVTRNTNGTPRAQGWCRECRSKTNYHKRSK